MYTPNSTSLVDPATVVREADDLTRRANHLTSGPPRLLIPPAGERFIRGVEAKACDMRDTVRRAGRATARQLQAVQNMRQAIERWAPREVAGPAEEFPPERPRRPRMPPRFGRAPLL